MSSQGSSGSSWRLERDNSPWEQGDIAFLSVYSIADRMALIDTGVMDFGATGHPVVILRACSPYFIITPVSAFGSGEHNDYRAPWKQGFHRSGNKRDFRSIEGCERASSDMPFIKLVQGQTMPKPRASWINTNRAWIVPGSVLEQFSKSPYRIRLAPQSLADLANHVARRHAGWASKKHDPRIGKEQLTQLVGALGITAEPQTSPALKSSRSAPTTPARAMSPPTTQLAPPVTTPPRRRCPWRTIESPARPTADSEFPALPRIVPATTKATANVAPPSSAKAKANVVSSLSARAPTFLPRSTTYPAAVSEVLVTGPLRNACLSACAPAFVPSRIRV